MVRAGSESCKARSVPSSGGAPSDLLAGGAVIAVPHDELIARRALDGLAVDAPAGLRRRRAEEGDDGDGKHDQHAEGDLFPHLLLRHAGFVKHGATLTQMVAAFNRLIEPFPELLRRAAQAFRGGRLVPRLRAGAPADVGTRARARTSRSTPLT